MSRFFSVALYGFAIIMLFIILSACDDTQTSDQATTLTEEETVQATGYQEEVALLNNITLSKSRGTVRDEVDFTIDELEPNQDYQLKWVTRDGTYKIDDLYAVIGPAFTAKEIQLIEGTSNQQGVWKGTFTVPEGFGGDHTIYVTSEKERIGQTGFIVDPTFTMSPKSGPVGTEITIKVEGLGWSTYMRNWQLTYDNQYTGLVTAISTNGTAEAKIRAAGQPGMHAIRLRTGYLGSQYINYKQSPYPDKPAPDFMFEVTDEEPVTKESYVEETPIAADGGVEMPAPVNEQNVTVDLNKQQGIVGENVQLKATGLPKQKEVEVVWNTMKGSRVTGLGFTEQKQLLTTVNTDANGKLVYDFQIPDDLGGIPHRIDLKIDDVLYGQSYLRILPSIVDISPKKGPVGTKVEVTIKGGGWTEFDNAYYLTYDNAYAGYMCAFNSQGTLTFDFIATGAPGYHVIDLYPGIYKQQEKETDMTLIPQLTYSTDHPGSAMPAIRLGFEVTE